MTPVWELILRPVGSLAEKVRVSPAAGRREVAGDIEREALPLKSGLVCDVVAVGPLSPTWRLKLSLIALPWASVAVTVIALLP